MGAAIEQNHDENGIIWPAPLAPFDVVLVPINQHRSDAVREAAELLYEELRADGIEVLLDDRDSRPGVKFADAEFRITSYNVCYTKLLRGPRRRGGGCATRRARDW